MTKTNALESLVIASFVRVLSVRDVEAALAEVLGDQAAISKSMVSAVCGEIKDEYGAMAERRLDGVTLDYLFLDASFLRIHPGSLGFPAEHHRRILHSNFIERTFGETRRRSKVIGRLPGKTICLTLVWAVLDRASRGWRVLTMTANGLRLLHDLRRSLIDPPRLLRHAPSQPARTTTHHRMSVPSPNVTMNRNRARHLYTGFRTPPWVEVWKTQATRAESRLISLPWDPTSRAVFWL